MSEIDAGKVKLKFVRSDGAVFGGAAVEGADSDGWNVGCGAQWSIPNDGLENFANLPYNVKTAANVLKDGSSLVSKRVDEVDRTVKMVYSGQDPDAGRAEAISFFNPRFSFKLYAQYRGMTRYCEGELYAFDSPAGNVHKAPEATVTLLCLDPYWKSVDGNENSLTDTAPMFGFPYVSHVKQKLPNGEKYPVGFLASKMLYDGMNTVYNSGDVPAMYRVHVDFEGYVLSPTITKDDRHVKVIYDFYDGDTLDIDFTATPPTVEINGKNAIGQCSRDSNFTGMEMTVGPNIFNYTCDNTANRPYMNVQVLFHKNYLGV